MSLRLFYYYTIRPPQTLHGDIAYAATHAKQRLDVHESTIQNSPVVLFVHGGAWGSGDKWQYALLGR